MKIRQQCTLTNLSVFDNHSFDFFSRQLFPTNEEEEEDHLSRSELNEEQGMREIDSNDGGGKQVQIEELLQNCNKKQRRILSREYQRQGNQCCSCS